MTWQHPWVLWFLLALPFIAWRMMRRRSAAGRFSSVAIAATLKPTWRIRLRWLPGALRLLAVALMIVALARPQEDDSKTTITSDGIAIEMLLDHSGSMQAMDFRLHGQAVDRLTAVKDVAERFVLGEPETDLKGRPSDLVGLIRFARFADQVSPLTLDHGYLAHQLHETQIVTNREEDGTAIGDAIGLGVERIKALQATRKHNDLSPLESKVIILLTDGENNAGDLDPIQAAELAKSLGVRIYTIGVGTEGRAPVPVINRFTGEKEYQYVQVTIDEETLKKIAAATEGHYFRATNTQSLRDIYARINELETTRFEEHTWGDRKELAVQAGHFGEGQVEFPALALLALGLLASETILSSLLVRRTL